MKSIASTISRWVDLGRRTPAARRVEQVGDQLLLLIGQRDNEPNAAQPGGRPCQLSRHKPRDPNANFRLQAPNEVQLGRADVQVTH